MWGATFKRGSDKCMDTKGESWGWDELGDWDPHIYILLTLCIKKITIENLKKKERERYRRDQD